ncbi:hypothetical protein [Longibacter sp.]|uniref:hypothetical protein n=1 Tax=Longibacter sp. TaxID=2045415 RepID=UPI003EBBB605
MYVFRRHLDRNGHVARADDGTEWISLSAEIQYDDEGQTKLVNWRNEAWVGEDEREATVERDELTFDWNLDRTELWVCLSHVQLPRHRIEAYLANANRLLESRCTRIFLTGFTAGRRPSGGWYIPLFDPVHLAQQIQVKYEAAIHRARAHTIQHAATVFHGSLYKATAEAYKQQEDEDHAPGRPTDHIDSFLETYSSDQQSLEREIQRWSRFLFSILLDSPKFTAARDDATEFAASIEDCSDTQLDKVESEVLRQMEILMASGDSTHGLNFLKEYLANNQDDATNWYERVALATRLTRRLSQISESYLESLHEKAELIERSSEEALSDLRARRVRANGLLLEHLETVRVRVSGSRRQRVTDHQLRILEPLHEGLFSGQRLILPGDAAFDDLRDAMLSSGRGDLSTQLRTGSTAGLLRAHQILMPNPSASLQSTQLSTLRMKLVDPRAVANVVGTRRHLSPQQFVQTFQFETSESGLIVAKHRDFAAIANASDILSSSGSRGDAPSAAQRRDAYIAKLRQLSPVSTRGGRENLAELSAAIDEHGDRVSATQIEAELRTRQLNYAGRFLLALDVLDVATGIPDLIDKIEAGQQQQQRGQNWWASYQGAVASGLGLGSAVAGSVEGVEHLLPRTALRSNAGTMTRLAIGLRVVGVVGAVLGAVAAAITLASESDQHDTFGAWSAGLALGASVLILLSMIKALSFLGPVGIGLALLSVVVFLFADTKLEELLRTCAWSEEERAAAQGLDAAALRERHQQELVDLLQLLARPQLSMDLLDADGAIYTYGSSPGATPTFLRLTVRPGFHPPGTTYEVSDFRISHAIDDVADSVAPDDMQIPSPGFDLVLTEDTGSDPVQVPRGFVRQWKIQDLDLRTDTQNRLQMPAAGFSFRAEVRVQIQEVATVDDLDQSYHMRGPVGYIRGGRLHPSRTTTVESRPS